MRPTAKLPLHYEEDENTISEHVSLKSPSFLAPLSSYNNGASFLESAGSLACPNQEDVQPLQREALFNPLILSGYIICLVCCLENSVKHITIMSLKTLHFPP